MQHMDRNALPVIEKCMALLYERHTVMFFQLGLFN